MSSTSSLTGPSSPLTIGDGGGSRVPKERSAIAGGTTPSADQRQNDIAQVAAGPIQSANSLQGNPNEQLHTPPTLLSYSLSTLSLGLSASDPSISPPSSSTASSSVNTSPNIPIGEPLEHMRVVPAGAAPQSVATSLRSPQSSLGLRLLSAPSPIQVGLCRLKHQFNQLNPQTMGKRASITTGGESPRKPVQLQDLAYEIQWCEGRIQKLQASLQALENKIRIKKETLSEFQKTASTCEDQAYSTILHQKIQSIQCEIGQAQKEQTGLQQQLHTEITVIRPSMICYHKEMSSDDSPPRRDFLQRRYGPLLYKRPPAETRESFLARKLAYDERAKGSDLDLAEQSGRIVNAEAMLCHEEFIFNECEKRIKHYKQEIESVQMWLDGKLRKIDFLRQELASREGTSDSSDALRQTQEEIAYEQGTLEPLQRQLAECQKKVGELIEHRNRAQAFGRERAQDVAREQRLFRIDPSLQAELTARRNLAQARCREQAQELIKEQQLSRINPSLQAEPPVGVVPEPKAKKKVTFDPNGSLLVYGPTRRAKDEPDSAEFGLSIKYKMPLPPKE